MDISDNYLRPVAIPFEVKLKLRVVLDKKLHCFKVLKLF